MCGIFGYSFKHSRLSAARRAVLATNLARYNDDRGGDSWGVVGINSDGYHVSRGLGDLSDHAFQLCEYQTLFAHTRAASSGEVNMKNAHPFKIGKILGAHNGAVYNHEDLCGFYKRNFPVDSMHLFAHLNEDRPFNELVARGAIEWIKIDDPKTIYLSKLFNGELAVYSIGDDEDPDGVVWSSNYKHLLKALLCTGLYQHSRYEVRRGHVYFVNNGVFGRVPDMKLHVTEPVFTRPNVEVVEATKVHYRLEAGTPAACGEKAGAWSSDKTIADCFACLQALNGEKEAPPSDEAGAVQFRRPAKNQPSLPIYRRANHFDIWRFGYAGRPDV